jgi:hypothetical protein
MAEILKPSSSILWMILPMMFFFTASGLMMARVFSVMTAPPYRFDHPLYINLEIPSIRPLETHRPGANLFTTLFVEEPSTP